MSETAKVVIPFILPSFPVMHTPPLGPTWLLVSLLVGSQHSQHDAIVRAAFQVVGGARGYASLYLPPLGRHQRDAREIRASGG